MAKGRKRKPGKRSKSGRISRAGIPRYDKGTEHAQAMQALYGQDGADALGRAFHAKLLGEGSDAKAMLDTGRRIFSAYWAAYATGSYRCPLEDRAQGGAGIDPEAARKREDWLNEQLRIIDAMGITTRRAFDALVIDIHPDSGPSWLDRIIACQRSRAEVPPNALASLSLAIDALSHIAGVDVSQQMPYAA